MLLEYKKIYELQANGIKNWKRISKSELCLKYIEFKDIDNDLAEQYLAAIIFKVINRIYNYYNKQSFKVLSEEDCYDVMIQSILYVLDKKVWENKESSLYGNKDAPEIAINMRIKTQLMNLCCAKYRQKRRVNSESLSLDLLEEESSEGYYIPIEDSETDFNLFISKLIHKYFSREEYLSAFIIDSIVSSEAFTKTKNNPKFSVGKLKSSIRRYDDKYSKIFSDNYNISLTEIKKALKYIKDFNLDKEVPRALKQLKRDKEIYLYLHNAY